PLSWILAGAQARRGKTIGAAVLVGLSAGVETWGILGIAVLGLAPRLRSAVLSASVAATVAVAVYLPFVLAGRFEMGAYQWQVSSDALISYFIAPGTPAGWSLRIAQGAC